MWWAWLLVLTVAILVAFGTGWDIARELTEHRLAARSLRLFAREAALKQREAEKRVITTLKVHEGTKGKPIYIRPPEYFVRVPWWTS